MSKDTTTGSVDAYVKEYWLAVRDLIDAAGKYAAAVKLKNNLLDRTTAWKVKHILKEHYADKMSNLEDAIEYRSSVFNAKVDKVNILCRQNGIHIISKKNVLLNLLLSDRKRRSYRGKMERRLAKNQICPLQDFEK